MQFVVISTLKELFCNLLCMSVVVVVVVYYYPYRPSNTRNGLFVREIIRLISFVYCSWLLHHLLHLSCCFVSSSLHSRGINLPNLRIIILLFIQTQIQKDRQMDRWIDRTIERQILSRTVFEGSVGNLLCAKLINLFNDWIYFRCVSSFSTSIRQYIGLREIAI